MIKHNKYLKSRFVWERMKPFKLMSASLVSLLALESAVEVTCGDTTLAVMSTCEDGNH